MLETINKAKSIKITVCGSSSPGVSCIVSRFVRGGCFERDFGTLIEFSTKSLPNGLELQIWEISTDPQFDAVVKTYVNDSQIVIICYDLTNLDSFTAIESIRQTIAEHTEKLLILVGNKLDLADKYRQVSCEQGAEYAKKHHMLFFECSAKENTNVDKIFLEAIMVLNLIHGGFNTIGDQNCDIEAVKLLVAQLQNQYGVNLNHYTYKGDPFLHCAIKFGNMDVVKWLIGSDIDVTTQNSEGKTAIDLMTEVEGLRLLSKRHDFTFQLPISSLVLRNCQIDDIYVREVLRPLFQSNKFPLLDKLDLGFNLITWKGVNTIVEALKYYKLKALNLENNRINCVIGTFEASYKNYSNKLPFLKMVSLGGNFLSKLCKTLFGYYRLLTCKNIQELRPEHLCGPTLIKEIAVTERKFYFGIPGKTSYDLLPQEPFSEIKFPDVGKDASLPQKDYKNNIDLKDAFSVLKLNNRAFFMPNPIYCFSFFNSQATEIPSLLDPALTIDAEHWVVGLIADDVPVTGNQHADIIMEYMNKFGQRKVERYGLYLPKTSSCFDRILSNRGTIISSAEIDVEKIRFYNGSFVIKKDEQEMEKDAKKYLIAAWKVNKVMGRNLLILIKQHCDKPPQMFSKFLMCGNQNSKGVFNCIKYAVTTLRDVGVPVLPLPNSVIPLIPSEEVIRQKNGVVSTTVVTTNSSANENMMDVISCDQFVENAILNL